MDVVLIDCDSRLKRKALFEYEQTFVLLPEAEVRNPTDRRGGQTLVRLKSQSMTSLGFEKTFKSGLDTVKEPDLQFVPAFIFVQRRRRCSLPGPDQL